MPSELVLQVSPRFFTLAVARLSIMTTISRAMRALDGAGGKVRRPPGRRERLYHEPDAVGWDPARDPGQAARAGLK
jgi:hypothetical protein